MTTALRVLQPRLFISASNRSTVSVILVRYRQSGRDIIGKREVVGFGYNGNPSYVDRMDFPFPAIRWKEPTADIQALRAKEQGDWTKLSVDEKKALYRASFRETLEEMQAPTGEWKSVLGGILFFGSFSLWIYYSLKTFLYVHFPLPDSFRDENRRAQFRRMLDLRVNPIEGLGSWWDYDRDDWKR